MNKDAQIIKDEEKDLAERLKRPGYQSIERDRVRKEVTAEIIKSNVAVETAVNKLTAKLEEPLKLDWDQVQVNVPPEQVIKGKVGIIGGIVASIAKWPAVQKVAGKVEALVKFPDIQKVSGDVNAKVDFPDVQKVKFDTTKSIPVGVEFPKMQKIEGRVDAGLPLVELGPNKVPVVAVALFDGKRFVEPFSTPMMGGGGGGNSDQVTRQILNLLKDPSPLSRDFFLEAARGNIPGIGCINKFGRGVVAGAVAEPVWDGSSLTAIVAYTYMTSASTLYISSDAAGDDQVYSIQGLDGNWDTKTVEVTANGVSFVPLTGTWRRVFRIKNLGTTDNAGNIYVSDDNTDVGGNGIPDTLTNVKAMIGVGNNQTLMAIYTVPSGKTAYVVKWYSSMGKGDDGELTLRVRPSGGVFQIKDHQHIFQTYGPRPFEPYLKVLEKEDIEVRGQVGAAGGEISAGFDIILVDN